MPRFLKDISDNILDNAYVGEGNQLDLVYKQATLRPAQYRVMVKMWGPPERAICCIREPSGYVVSAVNKFIYDTVEHLQQLYVRSINSYDEIKGDVSDYTPELTVSDYVAFLTPLDFEDKNLPSFSYRGQQDIDKTTEEMWRAYHKLHEIARN